MRQAWGERDRCMPMFFKNNRKLVLTVWLIDLADSPTHFAVAAAKV